MEPIQIPLSTPLYILMGNNLLFKPWIAIDAISIDELGFSSSEICLHSLCSCYGNASLACACFCNHVDWQVVKWCFPVIHLQTSTRIQQRSEFKNAYSSQIFHDTRDDQWGSSNLRTSSQCLSVKQLWLGLLSKCDDAQSISLSLVTIQFCSQCFLPLHPFVALAPQIALLSHIRGFRLKVGTWRFNKLGNCVPSPNSCATCFSHQLTITELTCVRSCTVSVYCTYGTHSKLTCQQVHGTNCVQSCYVDWVV